MSECEEVARNIAAKLDKTCLKGLRSMHDAENIVKLYMPDETNTIRCNVAEALLRIGRSTN